MPMFQCNEVSIFQVSAFIYLTYFYDIYLIKLQAQILVITYVYSLFYLLLGWDPLLKMESISKISYIIKKLFAIFLIC